MRKWLSALAVASLLCPLPHDRAEAADLTAGLVTEEFMVDAAEPGIQLYVRNKHPADMAQVPAGHVLLYVHGATQPSEATFDLPLEGLSWMDYIASHGWDVYLMDARGYGRSTRSAELLQANAAQAPVVWTDAKVQDAGAVIDFILRRRGVPKINLLGWSWGTIVTAAYAADHGDKVGGLVLYAPVWCEGPCDFDPQMAATLSAAHAKNPGSGPVVESSPAGARKRFQSGVPADRRDELMPPAWFAAWSAADLATDPVGAKKDPPAMRVPPGISEESQAYWEAGKSYYDPKTITAPALVVVAEWDELTPPSGARALHDALANSGGRRLVELKEGSHIIMLEKNRMALFQTVQQFLDGVGAAP
jgi:pimeloyl-ACP methyl ester carboxylesterase